MENIGARLKKVRGTKSAKAFADLIGCCSQSIYRYEWGERVPDNSFLQAVAEKTGCSLEWLKGTEKDLDIVKRNRKNNSHDSPMTCPQCVDLKLRLEKTEARLDALEEERRVVSTENRQLHKDKERLMNEIAELRAEVAMLKERLKDESVGGNACSPDAEAQSA